MDIIIGTDIITLLYCVVILVNSTLFITDAPLVGVGQYNPLIVEENEDVTLTCEVRANPSVNDVTWSKNDNTLSRESILLLSRDDLITKTVTAMLTYLTL